VSGVVLEGVFREGTSSAEDMRTSKRKKAIPLTAKPDGMFLNIYVSFNKAGSEAHFTRIS
jgi:hypothetical protein